MGPKPLRIATVACGRGRFRGTAATPGFADVPCLLLEASPTRLRRSGAAGYDPKRHNPVDASDQRFRDAVGCVPTPRSATVGVIPDDCLAAAWRAQYLVAMPQSSIVPR